MEDKLDFVTPWYLRDPPWVRTCALSAEERALVGDASLARSYEHLKPVDALWPKIIEVYDAVCDAVWTCCVCLCRSVYLWVSYNWTRRCSGTGACPPERSTSGSGQ